MSVLNLINCGGDVNNTGVGDCDFSIKDMSGYFLHKASGVFNETELATFDTVVQDYAKTDNPINRIYPFYFSSVNEETTDGKTQEEEDGTVHDTKDGKSAFSARFNAGKCLYNTLRSFNGKHDQFRIVFIDKAINGYIGTNVTGGGMRGFSLSRIYTELLKLPTPGNIQNVMQKIQLKESTELDNIAPVTFDKSSVRVLDLAKGLQTIGLKVTTPLTAGGAVVVKATTACGQVDLYDTYSTNLEEVTAWKPYNASTGVAIPVTSVALAPAPVKGFTVTMDDTDPAYPATDGKIVFGNDVPSVLEASPINMPGFEGKSITLIVP